MGENNCKWKNAHRKRTGNRQLQIRVIVLTQGEVGSCGGKALSEADQTDGRLCWRVKKEQNHPPGFEILFDRRLIVRTSQKEEDEWLLGIDQ